MANKSASSLGGTIAAGVLNSLLNEAMQSAVGVELLGGAIQVVKVTKTTTTLQLTVANNKFKMVCSRVKK